MEYYATINKSKGTGEMAQSASACLARMRSPVRASEPTEEPGDVVHTYNLIAREVETELLGPAGQTPSPSQHTPHPNEGPCFQKQDGAREMAQELRALTALVEDLGLVLNTHTAAHNCLELQLQGI